MKSKALTIGLLPLVAACVTTQTTSRTWVDSNAAGPERHGRVEWIRETVQQQQGDPAGGAVLGAVIGGILGHAITGRPGGTLVGAVGGAAVGASSSQGSAESRFYDVAIRFDDGGMQVFRFVNATPFAVGDRVTWRTNRLWRTSPAPGPPPPSAVPPPPPNVPPPPPAAGPPPPPQ